MGNADMRGGGGEWIVVSADLYEKYVLQRVRGIAKDATRLAHTERGSEDAARIRAQIQKDWVELQRDLSLMRLEEQKATKLLTRDLLYARLEQFYRSALNAKTDVPLINWQQAFDGALRWLAAWSGVPEKK